MTFGGNDFDILHSDAAKLGCDEIGGPLHVGFMLSQSANAGDAKQIFEFSQESLLIFTSVINRGRCHRVPFSV